MASGDVRRWIVPAEWLAPRALFAGAPEEARPVPMGAWTPIFDGRSLEGWEVTGRNKASWAVEDGAIYCQGKGGGYLRSVDQYGDFALAAEFMVDKRTNSGIFVRWSDPRDPVNTGIEVQLFDSAGKTNPGKHDSGAIYDLVPPSRDAMRPAGEWNRVVVSCQGPYIGVRLNGAAVAEINLDRYTRPGRNPDGSRNKFRYALASLPRRGHIGLQDHRSRVWYRNLRLMPL